MNGREERSSFKSWLVPEFLGTEKEGEERSSILSSIDLFLPNGNFCLIWKFNEGDALEVETKFELWD